MWSLQRSGRGEECVQDIAALWDLPWVLYEDVQISLVVKARGGPLPKKADPSDHLNE